ncbi:MAG: hypothetical protein V4642_02220 [Bacteroidota bacterium]
MKSFLFLCILMIFIGCEDPVEPETLIAKDYLRGTWRVTYAGQQYDELISAFSNTLSVNYVEYTGTFSGRKFKGTKHYTTPNAETDVEVEYIMVTQDSIRGVNKTTMTSAGDVVTTTTAPFSGFRK